MKEPVLATAANAVDHAVERRVLLVDWIDLASGIPKRAGYRRNTITRYGNRIAILSELTEPRTPDARGGVTGHVTPMATRELMERFDMCRSA
jgi:hypothetical protein